MRTARVLPFGVGLLVAACAGTQGAAQPAPRCLVDPLPAAVWIPPAVVALATPQGPALAAVHGFWASPTEVTAASFAAFVADTGHRTTAELPQERRLPAPAAASNTPPHQAMSDRVLSAPGAYVWDFGSGGWRATPGASWQHPTGKPGTPQPHYPVVHLSRHDAEAYAQWRGGRLPSAQEQQRMAAAEGPTGNTWQGTFPTSNQMLDGWAGTSPVGCSGANALGLYDVLGNVWEWTAADPLSPEAGHAMGGSYLCDASVCRGARQGGTLHAHPDLAASHLGVRVVFDAPFAP